MRKNTKAKKTNTKSKNIKPAKSARKNNNGKGGNNFEIFALCLSAFCLYMLVCIYSKGNSGGIIGKLINGGITAVMGTCAYIFPIMTIGLVVYSLFMDKKGDSKKKVIYSGRYFSDYVFTKVTCW